MTNRRRHLVKFCRSGLAALPFLCAALFFSAVICKGQDNPVLKIEDYVTRFAYSSGGRIAYSTQHVFSVKKIQLQRDDIWICEPDGKKHRILLGEKFVRGSVPFSYIVRGLRWSPDGHKLSIELGTSEMINEDGDTREGVSTLLLDDTGREITIAGADSVILGASNAAWLADGATVVYLTERAAAPSPTPPAAKAPSTTPPEKLFAINQVRPLSAGDSALFQGHLFSAVSWSAKQDTGVAIERDPGTTGLPHLMALNPSRNTLQLLGTPEGYAGALSISPSGKRVAYWIDNGQLEVRDVDAPNRVARLHVPLGILAWSGDETRVLVKRGALARSGGLVWFALPPLVSVAAGAAPAAVEVAPRSVLHDLEFRLFDISPDGKSLAVVEPGRRNLLVYPIS